MFLPITFSNSLGGFGPWERCRGRLHPLDLWSRCGVDLHPVNPVRSLIPRSVQLGFGDMHLDDWISPGEMIGVLFSEEDRAPTKSGGLVLASDKNVFEVKLNVKDYKPEELNVKISNGLVTIEGKHEKSTVPEKDKDGKPTGPEEHVYAHFKRTFTIPKNVNEEKLECKLTEDGQLVMSAPVYAIEPPSEPPVRSIPIATAGGEKQLENKETNEGENGKRQKGQ